jgi:MFS transporter, putative metabolite:H+ symporter
MSNVNNTRLFNASCFALITTAFAFAIRAGTLTKFIGPQFGLTGEQMGVINLLVLGIGFPIATIAGGLLYNNLGPKKMMMIALVCHFFGILMTIGASGYPMLLASSFLVGFGNGMVEAACNPLIAAMYRNNVTTMLNKFHVWFPGGILIGSLISNFMTDANLGWQLQVAIMLIPTVIYAYLFWGQTFPQDADAGQTDIPSNLSGMFTLLYVFIGLCMILTANTELSTQQWVEALLRSSGAKPMLVLALTTGIMATGRYFGGPLIHRLNPTGVLWGSAFFAALGIFMLSRFTGGMTYVAAVVFAIGVCYFWPTMLGFVGEYIPRSGALGMSVMGGIGMFATGLMQPVVGRWIDDGKKVAEATGATGADVDLVAGQATLSHLLVFPICLIVAFGVLWFWMRSRGQKPEE